MRKKRQYHIWQYKLDDIYENDGKLMVNFSEEEAINSSETLMLYILNEKIRERKYDDVVEYKTDEKGNELRVKKNYVPIMTVETGRSRNKEQTAKKTVTVDYLTKKRVDNKNLEPMYRIENNHEPIISKEMFDLVQQERKRRFEITKGENDDIRKYTNKYGFSGKLYCEKCGKTLKRRHWNSGNKSAKIVWHCNSYFEGKKNCSEKAVDDLILKRAFIQLYNDMVVDKGSFLKVFLENVEKVINKDTIGADISKTSNEITQLEQDLSELVQLKIRKQIDDKYYNKKYAKITAEIETLNLKRNELLNSKLNDTKHKKK